VTEGFAPAREGAGTTGQTKVRRVSGFIRSCRQ
jgi:hypothetical protein